MAEEGVHYPAPDQDPDEFLDPPDPEVEGKWRRLYEVDWVNDSPPAINQDDE